MDSKVPVGSPKALAGTLGTTLLMGYKIRLERLKMERNLDTKFCDQIGDYHIISPDNGFYEVWRVNPFDTNDDTLMEECEDIGLARMAAQFFAEVDRANAIWLDEH
jgi:hypothetical protein